MGEVIHVDFSKRKEPKSESLQASEIPDAPRHLLIDAAARLMVESQRRLRDGKEVAGVENLRGQIVEQLSDFELMQAHDAAIELNRASFEVVKVSSI